MGKPKSKNGFFDLLHFFPRSAQPPIHSANLGQNSLGEKVSSNSHNGLGRSCGAKGAGMAAVNGTYIELRDGAKDMEQVSLENMSLTAARACRRTHELLLISLPSV